MNEPVQGGIHRWMQKIEADLIRLDDKWQKSVDDIKRTIVAEISELKAEQIAELRRRIDDGYRTLGLFETRMRDLENGQRDLNTGRTIVNWIINTAIAVAAAIAGYVGGKHIF